VLSAWDIGDTGKALRPDAAHAMIVRPLLLPAAASLLGRRSWWPLSRQAAPRPARMPAVPAERLGPSSHTPVGA